MSIDAHMLAVVESLYEAAMDETRWPDTLQQVSELTESQAATFWVLDGGGELQHPTFTFVNIDPAFVQAYLQMAARDPTVQYLVRHPHQSIVHDGLVISERDKDRSAYYDWQHRLVLTHRQDHAKLQGLITRAILDVTRPDAGGAIQARRPSNKRPYAVLVSPVVGRYPTLSSLRPAVCVVIVDPDAEPSMPVGRLRAVLGLTEAEARLAALLQQAMSCERRRRGSISRTEPLERDLPSSFRRRTPAARENSSSSS